MYLSHATPPVPPPRPPHLSGTSPSSSVSENPRRRLLPTRAAWLSASVTTLPRQQTGVITIAETSTRREVATPVSKIRDSIRLITRPMYPLRVNNRKVTPVRRVEAGFRSVFWANVRAAVVDGDAAVPGGRGGLSGAAVATRS